MTRLFTVAEAGAITGLQAKAVHDAIDTHIVEPVAFPTDAPRGRRLLSGEDLVRLTIWHATGGMLSNEQRRSLFAAIAASPRTEFFRAAKLLIVDVAEARRQVEQGIRDLEAAESIVVRDKAILGGEPVIRGTRIPAHAIAAMQAAGASAEALLAGYPALSRRQLDLAGVWSAAHPRRGRPKPLSEPGLTVKGSRRVPAKDDPHPSGRKSVAPAAE